MALFASRRPVAVAVAGVAACAALLGVAACSNDTSTPASPGNAAAPSAAPGAGGHHHGKAKGVAGKITAENGTSWTVVTAKGKQYTVNVTPQTKFGTTAAPATQQQFAVGDAIRARGKVAQETVTATHITHAKAAAASTAPAPAPAG
jgi:hypothetical protein